MYLLLLGVFAGVGLRAFGNPNHKEAADSCPVVSNCSDADPDCHDTQHSDDEHGPECPSEPHEHHHHHGPCCGGNYLTVRDADGLRLVIPAESRLEISLVGSIIPDGPVLSEDKPPLI
jgi:hypothetical protein